MNISLVYTVSVSIAIFLGYSFIKDQFFNQRTIRRATGFIIDLKDTGGDDIFENVGIKLSMRRYLAIRNGIFIILAMLALSSYFKAGLFMLMKYSFAAVSFYVVTYPKEYFHGKKTPFKYILESLRKRYLDAKDAELMSVISQMKNLTLTHQGSPISAVAILTGLMRFTRLIKPIFAKTVTLLMRDKTKEACDYFEKAMGTRLGSNFATIILKLDALDPIEFIEQLEIFQLAVIENKKTKKIKRQENSSNILFVLASLLVLLITMNFIIMVTGSALIII